MAFSTSKIVYRLNINNYVSDVTFCILMLLLSLMIQLFIAYFIYRNLDSDLANHDSIQAPAPSKDSTHQYNTTFLGSNILG